MHNEATRQMADKHTAIRKAFNYIFQEEKVLEEARKDLQNNHNKILKLQKQVSGVEQYVTRRLAVVSFVIVYMSIQMENAKKKGDAGKCQTLEIDLTTVSASHTYYCCNTIKSCVHFLMPDYRKATCTIIVTSQCPNDIVSTYIL